MNIQLSDLIPVFHFADYIILLVKEEDLNTPCCRCCQVNLDTKRYYFFENIQRALKFTPYENITESNWESYREDIYQQLPDELIVEMLNAFDNENTNENNTKEETSIDNIKKIDIDIVTLNKELNNLDKYRDDILLKSKSYHDSYHVFVDYFRKLHQIELENFIIGSHFVYGWMPTILNMNLQSFDEKILQYLNAAKNETKLIEKNDLNKIIPHVNNSLVGASKLLHFINPEVYAIWDSNIFHYFFPEKKSTYGIDRPELYFEYLESLKLAVKQPNFDKLYKAIKLFFKDEELTPFRAVESLIFEIGKNNKRNPNKTHEP